MSTAVWTSQALLDLEEIGYHIAVVDGRPETAERILRELQAQVEVFARQPELGEARPDLAPGLRCGRFKRWVFCYEVSAGTICVLRVIDGSRDFPTLFGA